MAYDMGSMHQCPKAREYEEVSTLGRGAYGKVYLVNHRPTNTQYALKRIQVYVSKDGVPQSVLREIATMKSFKRLSHRNVLRIFDVYHELHTNRRQMITINIIVDRCDWDLYSFLRDIPRDMPEHQTRVLARQIFEGLDYLHSMNIIHRDIKPQNILINRDLSVKIADFGLSRSYGSQSTVTTVVVTLWYRSPELLMQCKYNTGVDVWSIGCILSELYAREPLFPGQTEAQQLAMIFSKLGTPLPSQWPQGSAIDRDFYPSYPPQSLERLNPKLPPDAADLLRRCLVFGTDQRISAKEALQQPYFMTGERVYNG